MTAAPLPVLPIVAAAFRSLREHLSAFLRLFWFPFLALTAAELTTRLVSTRSLDPFETAQDASMLGGAMLAMMLATLAMVPAATAWHRLILFGPQAEPPRFRLGRRELRYGLYLLLYCALVIVAAVPAGMVVFFGAIGLVALGVPVGYPDIQSLLAVAAFIGMLAALFATVRLFLLFPGIAIGQGMGLRQAGRASRGNQGRLFLASVVPMLPVSLLRLLTETPAGAGLLPTLLASTAASALLVPFFAASVSVLSLSYRALCHPPLPQAEEGTGTTADPPTAYTKCTASGAKPLKPTEA